MQAKQFRYALDNFGYLIHGDKEALAVDAGGARAVRSYLEARGLRLRYVVNTHGHPDHTVGTEALAEATGASVLDNSALRKQGAITIEGQKIHVYHTPGHTEDSLVFHAGRFLITGDTLFNGTVGNCFSGDLEAFYYSIRTLMAFPAQSVILAGHDYVEEAMRFAKTIEPGNPDINTFLKRYHPNDVHSTLAEELAFNPYLRFNEKPVVEFLKERGLPVETEYQRWESLMSIE